VNHGHLALYREPRNYKSFAEFAEIAQFDQRDVPKPKRITVQSKLFKNSVVMTTLGQSHTRRTEEARWDAEKRAFFKPDYIVLLFSIYLARDFAAKKYMRLFNINYVRHVTCSN